MFNWTLISPRNVAVVGAIAIGFHLLVKPLYQLIQGNNS